MSYDSRISSLLLNDTNLKEQAITHVPQPTVWPVPQARSHFLSPILGSVHLTLLTEMTAPKDLGSGGFNLPVCFLK